MNTDPGQFAVATCDMAAAGGADLGTAGCGRER